jgi:hypothetical protein
MQRQLTQRRTALATAAAALIAAASLFAANAAQAASDSAALDALLPLMAKAAAGARAAPKTVDVLPAPTGTARPFRQTMVGDCRFGSPLAELGDVTFCKFPPITVAANRLLEIKNISCLILPHYGVLFLSKSGNVANLFSSLVAFVFMGTSCPQGGPIYVAPGEKLFVWGVGAAVGEPKSPAFCTVHGLLSPTG